MHGHCTIVAGVGEEGLWLQQQSLKASPGDTDARIFQSLLEAQKKEKGKGVHVGSISDSAAKPRFFCRGFRQTI